jgi:predicted ATP-dependent Lon-type protease
MLFLLLMVICFACTEAERSHTQTVQIVVESFYQKNFSALENHTTKESFDSFMYIQDIIPAVDKRDSSFKVIQEIENGNTAWVQFSTVYEEQPETFKLIKEDGRWKVTEIEMGEKVPF